MVSKAGPAAALDTPSAPGVVVYYADSNNVAWSSPDSSGTSALTRYEMYADGALQISGIVWNAPYPKPTSGSVTFTVRACNSSGCGPYASVSYTAPAGTTGVAAGAPSAPGVVVYYADSNSVAWSSPGSSGTSALTGYEMYANGVLQASGVIWNAPFTKPTSGTVTFTVRACNSSGCGPFASTSYTATTPGTTVVGGSVPSAPGVVVYYPDSNTVAWSSPDSSGSSALTSYEMYANGALQASGILWSAAYAKPTSGTVTFTVRACNSSGCGPFASIAYSAPSVPPSAPGVIVYYPDSNTVAWSSPDSTGSTALTRYEFYANDILQASGIQWNASYPKPTSGTVTFTVRACNQAGCGPFASTSYTATPVTTVVGAGVPSAPGVVVYYADSNNVAWSSPASSGTSALTRYEMYANGVLQVSGIAWNAPYTKPVSGTVTFTVRACNNSGCGPFASTSYTGTGTPPGGVGVGQGVIIPAYYSLSDTQKWADLATAAAQMRDASNASVKDFWVTANYNNGPFSDWASAASRLNPIRNNGGKVFGYVYTHQSAYTVGANLVDKAKFRTVASIQADIASWVAGYPNLDGIWIDEFYPRHELATESGTLPSGASYDGRYANHPNGTSAAPPSYRTPGLDLYSTGQIDPTGGWYDLLFKWIRQTYPNLKIVANAGGQLYSNQYRYGALPDVLVSFEQNYATASANNYALLTRNDPSYAAAKQLALVHNVSSVSAMQAVVAKSKAAGFSHTFATDGVIGSNLWYANPAYLSALITELAGAPAPPTTQPPVTTAPPTTTPPNTTTPPGSTTPPGAGDAGPYPLIRSQVGTFLHDVIRTTCLTTDGLNVSNHTYDEQQCILFSPLETLGADGLPDYQGFYLASEFGCLAGTEQNSLVILPCEKTNSQMFKDFISPLRSDLFILRNEQNFTCLSLNPPQVD